MQATASTSYSLPPHHHPYHNPYQQIPPPIPQDHELKRQYLTLLPPQQIIDICLNFDLHVPLYVKNSIWPGDINAAIASLRHLSPQAAPPPPTPVAAPVPEKTSPPDGAIMDSLSNGGEPSSASTQESTNEPQPPDKEPSNSTTPGNSSGVNSAPAPAPAPSPAPPQAAYPQPYGYPPQAAYPHAPYYPPHPGYAQYPYPGYPPMPPPGYGPPLPPGAFPTLPNPHFANPTLTPLPHDPVAADDLPSYEEMIVEALTDSGDPEGCAPKDLFTWMASRYPLQSNFRPSASQALQKAFKRGRFEKGTNGKYRLNTTWEGGSTSRRTTRRPQTQTQTTTATSNPSPSSPFTHAPLVHHHQQQQSQPIQFQPQGYAMPYPQMPPPPGYPMQQQQHPAAPSQEKSSTVDAYEAAQSILKAINFGSLLQLPPEDETAHNPASIEQASGTATETSSAHPQPITAGIGPVSMTSSTLMPMVGAGGMPVSAATRDSNPRAELQAQLVLLAAQLSELANETEPPPPPVSVAVAPAATAIPERQEEEDSEEDDDDMEEVI